MNANSYDGITLCPGSFEFMNDTHLFHNVSQAVDVLVATFEVGAAGEFFNLVTADLKRIILEFDYLPGLLLVTVAESNSWHATVLTL